MTTSDVSGPGEWPLKKETIDSSFKPPLKSASKLASQKSSKESISVSKTKTNHTGKWSWKPSRN
jgi:hypothetical protein